MNRPTPQSAADSPADSPADRPAEDQASARSASPSRSRIGFLGAALAICLGLLAGCSDDDESKDKAADKSDARPEVVIVAKPGVVTGKLPKARATKVARAVGEVVDRWVEAAYLDPKTAFAGKRHPGFSKGLTRQARKDGAETSSRSLDGKVEDLETARKVVRVDIFSPDRRPAGATARFRVVFDATGDAAGRYVARGTLSLSPDKSDGWRVFGYDDVNLTKKDDR